MTRLLIFFILLIAGGLSGCLDHKIPSITPGLPVTRLRVKTLTLENPDNQNFIIALGYDGQGRLSTVNSYQTPDSSVSGMLRGAYFYDGQNRLTQLRRVDRAGAIDNFGYYYNEAGQVSQIGHSGGLTWYYGYTENGQLSSANLSYSHPRFSIRGDLKFAFTGNNLTQVTGRTGIRYQGMPEGTSDDFPGVSTATYTHDDKLNPFYGVFVIPTPRPGFVNVLYGLGTPGALFGGIDNVLTLSQNNVLTETSLNSKTTYQYQYNAANLPTVRVRTRTTPPPYESVYVDTLRFEYESY